MSRNDRIAGSVLALVMAAVFVGIGGKPLVVTFLPGLVVTWVLFLRLGALPEARRFYPIFFGTLGWQLLHFCEELAMRFHEQFPRLYGAEPFSALLFVLFNSLSYSFFAITCVLALSANVRFLIVPALFFVVYGAVGNAISHTWWVVLQGSYFPGFWTAQAYWILGPLALATLVGSWREALLATGALAAVLIPLLTFFRG